MYLLYPGPVREKLREWFNSQPSRYASSRLFRTEVIRNLRRDNYDIESAETFLKRVEPLEISSRIHTIAESIEPHIKALDSIHIATALTLSEPLFLATHDNRMAEVAKELGLTVIDPVAEILASLSNK